MCVCVCVCLVWRISKRKLKTVAFLYHTIWGTKTDIFYFYEEVFTRVAIFHRNIDMFYQWTDFDKTGFSMCYDAEIKYTVRFSKLSKWQPLWPPKIMQKFVSKIQSPFKVVFKINDLCYKLNMTELCREYNNKTCKVI